MYMYTKYVQNVRHWHEHKHKHASAFATGQLRNLMRNLNMLQAAPHMR